MPQKDSLVELWGVNGLWAIGFLENCYDLSYFFKMAEKILVVTSPSCFEIWRAKWGEIARMQVFGNNPKESQMPCQLMCHCQLIKPISATGHRALASSGWGLSRQNRSGNSTQVSHPTSCGIGYTVGKNFAIEKNPNKYTSKTSLLLEITEHKGETEKSGIQGRHFNENGHSHKKFRSYTDRGWWL